ncbi:helix-turn-helix domain-containing protein [Enterococcus rotai]|uniref:helix-turn-helix domain-containing protein n=1 Tax=Enterococcus rotai TaxID=118060 RepID=UPI0032B60A1F
MLFDRVKLLSEKRGKTLQEVALELGISVNALYKWRHQNPKIDTIQKAADYFQVSVDYLLGRTDDPYLTENDMATGEMIHALMSGDDKLFDLNKQIAKLSDKELDAIQVLIDSMVKDR